MEKRWCRNEGESTWILYWKRKTKAHYGNIQESQKSQLKIHKQAAPPGPAHWPRSRSRVAVQVSPKTQPWEVVARGGQGSHEHAPSQPQPSLRLPVLCRLCQGSTAPIPTLPPPRSPRASRTTSGRTVLVPWCRWSCRSWPRSVWWVAAAPCRPYCACWWMPVTSCTTSMAASTPAG